MIYYKELLPILNAAIKTTDETHELGYEVVLFEFLENNQLSITSTNGHSLFHAVLNTAHGCTPGVKFPVLASSLLEKMCHMIGADEVKITSFDKTLMIMHDQSVAMLDQHGFSDNFPDYKDVFNVKWPTTTTGKLFFDNRLFTDPLKPIESLMQKSGAVELSLHEIDAPIYLKPYLKKELFSVVKILIVIMPLTPS